MYMSVIKVLRASIWYMNDKNPVENAEVIKKFQVSGDAKCQNAI